MPGSDEYIAAMNRMMHQFGIYKRNQPPCEENSEKHKHLFFGIHNMATRLKANGGFSQQDRMIFDKRRSLDRALHFSYQAASVDKIACSDDFYDDKMHRLDEFDPLLDNYANALINPDKLKQDYDDKIISLHYEENYHVGDVFEWLGTNTYWLIYLQDLDELAYFRGNIRRCRYMINWEDEDGEHSTYAAVRGPVETKIDYIQKHQISVDNPNYSLHILMPHSEENVNQFKRYSKFYLRNTENEVDPTCWRVEATDWISTPGILEITAVEYYANESEDDIENGIVGGLIVKPISPNENIVDASIVGETFIKPKKFYEYEWKGKIPNSIWKVSDKYPVELIIDKDNPAKVKVKWLSPYSGEFELQYGTITKKIVVESLF